MDWPLLLSFYPSLSEGIAITFGLLFSGLALGLALGAFICWVRMQRIMLLAPIMDAYVLFFRGTPLLVQLFAIYFGLGQFEFIRESAAWVLLREPWFCAALALGLNSAAFTSEIMRGGILGVERGQLEAAEAYGFGTAVTARVILLPQALRIALPAYSNEVILMLKGTALASTISIMELTGIARRLTSQTFAPFEAFIAAGSIYLAISIMLTSAFAAIERRQRWS
ncbi:MAG: ABC transporter permease [Geminicoccaceae bacterium]